MATVKSNKTWRDIFDAPKTVTTPFNDVEPAILNRQDSFSRFAQGSKKNTNTSVSASRKQRKITRENLVERVFKKLLGKGKRK
jgi:hypothetical protein